MLFLISASSTTTKLTETRKDWNCDEITETLKTDWINSLKDRLSIQKKASNFADIYLLFPCLKYFNGSELVTKIFFLTFL